MFKRQETKVSQGHPPRSLVALCYYVGIWTKHIKAKTDLHQTVVDRCIKSLVQKQLIKPVKNVKVSAKSFKIRFEKLIK